MPDGSSQQQIEKFREALRRGGGVVSRSDGRRLAPPYTGRECADDSAKLRAAVLAGARARAMASKRHAPLIYHHLDYETETEYSGGVHPPSGEGAR